MKYPQISKPKANGEKRRKRQMERNQNSMRWQNGGKKTHLLWPKNEQCMIMIQVALGQKSDWIRTIRICLECFNILVASVF